MLPSVASPVMLDGNYFTELERQSSLGLVDCDDGARLSQSLPQHLGICIIARRGLWQDWNALHEVLP